MVLDLTTQYEHVEARNDWYEALADDFARNDTLNTEAELFHATARAAALSALQSWHAYQKHRDLHAEWRQRLEELPF